jgi:hypothetical protein
MARQLNNIVLERWNARAPQRHDASRRALLDATAGGALGTDRFLWSW